MKSPESLEDFSSLTYFDSSFSSEWLGRVSTSEQVSIKPFLERLSQLFHIDMAHYSSNCLINAFHERMEVCKSSNLQEYLSIIDNNMAEINAIFRQIVSAPDWGLTLVPCQKFIKLVELALDSWDGNKLQQIWITRCGLGYNVINFLLALEESLATCFGTLTGKQTYKVLASDIDFQLLRTASKLIVPDAYKEILYQGKAYSNLIEIRADYVQLKPAKRSLVNFAVCNHLQNLSMANFDLFIAVDLADRLNKSGQKVLVQSICRSMHPGGYILCVDPILDQLLLTSHELELHDAEQRIFRKRSAKKVKMLVPQVDQALNSAVQVSYSEKDNRQNKLTLDRPAPNVTSLFPNDKHEEYQALLQMKNDYIDLLHREIDELYKQIQDMTEELSTNLLELETVNEELRISNDQLTSVNDQYSQKLEELSLYLKDYDQITDALNLALIFVDQSKRIRFFNSRAEGLFDLCLKDLNRCFSDFMFAKNLTLEEMFHDVLKFQTAITGELSFKGINQRFIKALPFVVQQIKCEGVMFCIGDADKMRF